MEVSLVPAGYIHTVWPRVADYLEKSVEYTNGRFALADILHMISVQGYILWIAHEEDDIKGATVTGFTQYPRKKSLEILFAGGVDGWDWKQPMMDTLKRWAKDNQCEVIEGIGRDGWSRVFRSDGAQHRWSAFEISLVEDG